MSPTLFILSITLYLVCIVSTIILSFFYKVISPRLVNTVLIFHFLTIIFYFIFTGKNDSLQNPGTSNYLFLAFFCSALLISGLVLRMKYPVYLKVYISLFLLSVVFFIASPSRILGFISSGKPTGFNPKRLHLSENYFFVEQDVLNHSSLTSRSFKLVREMGMFHKTLARDVSLPADTDSILSLKFEENREVIIRIYFRKNHSIDSLDMSIPLIIERDSSNIITRKISS